MTQNVTLRDGSNRYTSGKKWLLTCLSGLAKIVEAWRSAEEGVPGKRRAEV